MVYHTTAAQQAETLATATRHRTHWTQSELDMVRSATEPLAKVAREVGRSLFSVTYARSVKQERAEKAAPRPALPFDRGFYDVESLFADE